MRQAGVAPFLSCTPRHLQAPTLNTTSELRHCQGVAARGGGTEEGPQWERAIPIEGGTLGERDTLVGDPMQEGMKSNPMVIMDSVWTLSTHTPQMFLKTLNYRPRGGPKFWIQMPHGRDLPKQNLIPLLEGLPTRQKKWSPQSLGTLPTLLHPYLGPSSPNAQEGAAETVRTSEHPKSQLQTPRGLYYVPRGSCPPEHLVLQPRQGPSWAESCHFHTDNPKQATGARKDCDRSPISIDAEILSCRWGLGNPTAEAQRRDPPCLIPTLTFRPPEGQTDPHTHTLLGVHKAPTCGLLCECL